MTVHSSLPAPRGRPREFDADAAVERAMSVFWTRGYHGTSLTDLLRATRLSRGSLYAAFGDKHTLFLRALDRYIDDALARLDREFDPRDTALEGLRRCVAGYIERTSGAGGKRGCLLVATAMELAGDDAEVAQRIRRFFKGMETRLVSVLTRMRATGALAAGVEPAKAAQLLLCLLEGMRVVGKVGPNPAVLQAAADSLIDRLTA